MRSNLRQPYSFHQSPSSITIVCFHDGNSNQIRNQKSNSGEESGTKNEKEDKIEVTIDELNFSIKKSNKPIIEGKLYAHIDKEFDRFSVSEHTTSVVIYKNEEERWPILILDKSDKGALDRFSEYQLAFYTMRIKKDQEKAMGFLKSSAQRGCPFAVMALANSFTNPNFFQNKYNKEKAIKWWTRAYELGCSPTAELSLGSLYFDERQNLENNLDNLKQAKKWFSLVGEKTASSCCYLGKIELALAEIEKKKNSMEEAQKGFNEAARLFKKSAFDMGLMESYFYFGIMQIEGYLETGKNFIKGKDLILMSITQGDNFNVPPKYSSTLTKVYQYEETKELGDLNSDGENEPENPISFEKMYHNFDQAGHLTSSEDSEDIYDDSENSEISEISDEYQIIDKKSDSNPNSDSEITPVVSTNNKNGSSVNTNTNEKSIDININNSSNTNNSKSIETNLQNEKIQELPKKNKIQNIIDTQNEDAKFEWLFTFGSIAAVGVANLLLWKTRK
ncbi:hypothetical protein M0813_02146 [Anaeramoeba flamelloides]|uniref:CS domain-containing protein n=1 Tax=Anaeramoeba flamelloides TaxID=1746091 RepID=A0ABQ8YQK8_9EUKA|nr:hypothetical protein M0813_02146 [Anaeramoeba flamelloides]